MWNWKKINTIKDLPAFERPVLVYQKRDGKKYATVASLVSIDAKGAKWSFSFNSLDAVFGGLFNLQTETKNDFVPTHWCDIEPPEDIEEPK
jgi:hypothetical protein